jgi:hypothetical protein
LSLMLALGMGGLLDRDGARRDGERSRQRLFFSLLTVV